MGVHEDARHPLPPAPIARVIAPPIVSRNAANRWGSGRGDLVVFFSVRASHTTSFARTRIRNALLKVCLAGGHLSAQLSLALDAIDSHPGDNFIILLSAPESLQYRALYAFDPMNGEVRTLESLLCMLRALFLVAFRRINCTASALTS